MMLCQGLVVHLRCDQGFGIQGLLDRDASNERRNLPWDFIQPAEHHMLAAGLYASLLQNIAQPRPRELRSTHGALAPLNAWNLRSMKTTPIPRALERVHY